MEWRLLGPLEVLAGGTPVNLGGRQRRTLLAVLAVHAGEPVLTDRLVEELWGDSPPATARKTVQAHVAHLRSALNRDHEVLASSSDGYVLRADPDTIDSRRFEGMAAEARENKANDPGSAARRLEEALDLFRGTPLAGLADNAFSLRVEAERLTELRVAAIEDRLDALLAAGQTQSVAAEAERLVAEHPLRERLWSILMLGLYRAGRQAEALRAYARLRRVLAEELGIEPSNELQGLEQRMLDQDAALAEGHLAGAITDVPETTILRNPYKGLRAFDEADAADFFGRSDLVRRLEERLESRSQSRLTLIAGPSGAGKSSVVRAGLAPRLRDRYRVGIMFPGEDPFVSLAKALSEATEEAPDDVLGLIEAGEPIGEESVIVVDQFEELFTLTMDEEAVQGFLDLIASRAQPIKWVVTVRADFLDRLLIHPRLGPALEDALVLIPTLEEHEIRAVVIGPAERVGVGVEPQLVVAVANDVQARPAALPLLQYALTDTFERRRGNELTLADYQRSGGLTGALARRAEGLFSALRPEQQAKARQLFLLLVTVGDDGELTKRRVERGALFGDRENTRMILERFGSQRLLIFDQDPETSLPTVEIAHEALISEWPRFAAWVEEARDDLRMARRLTTAVAEWEESERDPSFLLRGARLAEMEVWREAMSVPLNQKSIELLNQSRAIQNAEERRRRTRRRLVVSALGLAAVIALAFALVATNQQRIAQARGLAAASAANLDADPELALLLAMEAVRSSPEAVRAEAQEALHRAIQTQRAVFFKEGGGAAFISPDGRRVVGGGEAEVPVWDIDTGDEVMSLTGHTDLVFNAVWSRDGSLIATNGFDRTTRLWDADTGEQLWVVEYENRPISVAISPDSRHVAVSCCRDSDEGWVRVWDVPSRSLVAELQGPARGINFGLSGLLAVTGPGEITIWDVASDDEVATIEQSAIDVVFSDNGRYVAAAGGSDIILYDAENWEELHRFFGQTTEIEGIDITPDGRVLATGNIDGTVELWDTGTRRPLMTISGHGTAVINVAFGRDGTLLATGGADDTIRVFDIARVQGHEWIAFPSPAGDVDYHPDGTMIASAGNGVEIADSGTGELVRALEGRFVRRVEYSDDGSLVAATGFDGWTRVWDSDTRELLWQTLHVEGTGAVDFSPGGDRVLIGGADAYMHDGSSGDLLSSVAPYGPASEDFEESGFGGDMLFDLEFHPDGARFATSGSNGSIKMWDASDRSLVWSKQGHGGFDPRSLQIDFGPDGRLLASVGFDGTAKIYETASGEILRTLGTGAGGDLWALDFSADGQFLATGGADGLVTVWDVETGAKHLIVAEVPETVMAVDFSPRGDALAIGTLDLAAGGIPIGITRVYLLDPEALVDLGESRLTRWWTSEECATFFGSDTCPPPPRHLGDTG